MSKEIVMIQDKEDHGHGSKCRGIPGLSSVRNHLMAAAGGVCGFLSAAPTSCLQARSPPTFLSSSVGSPFKHTQKMSPSPLCSRMSLSSLIPANTSWLFLFLPGHSAHIPPLSAPNSVWAQGYSSRINPVTSQGLKGCHPSLPDTHPGVKIPLTQMATEQRTFLPSVAK